LGYGYHRRIAGIGAGLVTGYHAHGWAVVANSLAVKPSSDPALATVGAWGGDISQPTTADRIVMGALERFGRIDTLVNNAGVAPGPSRKPSREPAAHAPAREEPPPAAAVADGGGPVCEFFTLLGPDWRLTAAQRARLAPDVTTALAVGWTPQALGAFTGANASRVRNPYAVLAARLSPAELPLPHAPRASRPPWCGECDQDTRMLGFDGDAPRPCLRCKPAVARHTGCSGRFG
jgi:NAD(P)-dependent dehydrogenase (short-subunit alcohol dehydrogenase family)